MRAGAFENHSEWIVFVDESGDHSLTSIDETYPIFALTFCVIRKAEYIERLTPRVRALKFDLFGHDLVIFHEAEIVRKKGAFAQLGKEAREHLLEQLSQIMAETDFSIFAIIIDKKLHKQRYAEPEHPYHLAMQFGLERIYKFLSACGQEKRDTHFIFEARGSKEDKELELAFRRVCDGANWGQRVYPFKIVIADKKTNSEGLQVADLTARPIGLSVLRPDQANRAYDILKPKLGKYGRKVFP
ncbi:DUF3800 domain-containing protein [Pseudomonas sp. BN411]|uniref:DUF3800 domain-containing protein n=1 Tax=Pseudomonas sp. BN411 TaxID=2567887 RepID=UPI0024562964|nr:DUF3800 domain-containing protein [Pseudomonas sp. BN411]MDH4564097.1 DUF3800 domain-containing protein [Pseudomonas sp. BN411]